MSNTLAIVTAQLTKAYGRVQALQGVDLQVERGEIFGFLGPNGSGKTTTIRCLLDLIRPTSGHVRVLGIDPQADPVGVRARVGYLPGELRLDDNLSVRDALRYFTRLRGRQNDWAYVQTLAARLELDLRQTIKNLSKGNKQKVGVVQALMHRPELLLLDEPTSGLDPLVQREVLRLVREAQGAGATVFFSSHILSEVQDVAQRVAIIRLGRVVEVATTDSLIHRSVRRAHVRFAQPVGSTRLEHVPGVKVLSKSNGVDLTLQVEGQMDALIKALADFPVADFETERPSLEDVFMAYYEADKSSGS